MRTATRVLRVASALDGASRARGGVGRGIHVGRRAGAANSARSYDALAASLSDAQRASMEAYARAIVRENKGEHGTLTGALSADEVLEAHCGDALALLETFDRVVPASGGAVMDVGSGAGLPGIPLAIARPGWRFTLLDTLRKRTTFLEETTRELGLTNVDVVWGRAEDLGKEETHRERYDVVTARAVAELRVLAEFCLPLVKVGGRWVAAKNANATEEMADAVGAVALLGGGEMTLQTVSALGPDGNPRAVVVCEKKSPTPDKYPRRAGIPKKRPL